jgi:hypothetical protein
MMHIVGFDGQIFAKRSTHNHFQGRKERKMKKPRATKVEPHLMAGLPDGIFSNQRSQLGIFWRILQ